MASNESKKIIFSGIQPSGVIHLGNYLGAVKNWVTLQNGYTCLYSIADLHCLTVRQDPQALHENKRRLFCVLIACGLCPEKNIIYFQSHVPAHAELAWFLSCYTYMGELSRMTQFKEKSSKHADNINVGLYTYPVLMAADILLYRSDLVPVGEDQKQHLEICRDVAMRFNALYGDVFTVPEPFIGQAGARVMSLKDPYKKMSKSEAGAADGGAVYLTDAPDVIRAKFKKAVTDSENSVKITPEKAGIYNLAGIYSAVTAKTKEEIEAEFEGKNYGEFKAAAAEAVVAELSPINARYNELISDKSYIDGLIKTNAVRAASMAAPVLENVKRVIGVL